MDYTEILLPIRKIARAIHLDSKRIQKVCGLSIPQLLTLTYLSRCEDYQSSQLNLRKYLELNSSTTTGIVSRLEAKGLIAKLPKKGDKRSTWLSLTAAGLKKLDEAPPYFQERLMSKLSQLPKAKIQTITEGLEALISIMDIDHSDLDSNS